MKKLLSLLCAVVLLSGCSTTSSWFGGSDCQSKLAREFAENADTTVYFAYDKSSLSAEAIAALDSQVEWLKKNPKVNVVVQGYCDKRGTAEYNLALGERRAEAVKQYLVSQGVDGFDKVYNTVFKNGIKIPSTNKSIKINNIGGALKQVIFDRKSPFYVGFENLLEKYHVSISDEFLAITLLGSTIIKNIEIVDNGPKVEAEPTQSEVNDSVNDSFIEQSFEASDDN